MSGADAARRYFDLQTRGDIEGALAQFAPNAKFLGPMGELPLPDGVRAYLTSFQESFAGNGFRITNTIESDDQVALEGVWFGTHSGTLKLSDGSEIPATNKTIEAPFVTLFRTSGEKITEHRGYWDMAGFIGQLRG